MKQPFIWSNPLNVLSFSFVCQIIPIFAVRDNCPLLCPAAGSHPTSLEQEENTRITLWTKVENQGCGDLLDTLPMMTNGHLSASSHSSIGICTRGRRAGRDLRGEIRSPRGQWGVGTPFVVLSEGDEGLDALWRPQDNDKQHLVLRSIYECYS